MAVHSDPGEFNKVTTMLVSMGCLFYTPKTDPNSQLSLPGRIFNEDLLSVVSGMICFMYAPLLMFLKNPPHKTDQEKMENSVSTTDHNFFAILCGISFFVVV
jgi:hypothetical protein